MPGRVILAIDQGTTGSRVILFNRDGRAVGSAYAEFRQHYPKPAWVEHDAAEIWRGVESLIPRALNDAGLSPGDVHAVGITNQRETTVLWDRATGAPVAPAIVWQDRRTTEACQELKRAGLDELIRERTGLPIDPYFSATKLAWMLDHDAGLRRRAEKGELAFGTIDSWLIWNLTRGVGEPLHATDVSNASRTMLFNIHTLTWDAEILHRLRIPPAVLPEVRPCAGDLGRTGVAGLARVPVAGAAGDQQAALFGQCCFDRGSIKNTYGTGSFALMSTGTHPVPSRDLVATVAWKIGDEPAEYALEGSVFIAGAAVQWLRDGLGIIGSARETEALARSIDSNENVYFVPALAGLGAPHWDPDARGVLVGLTRGTTRAHLARAALEAICYQSRDVVDAMRSESALTIPELRADGGAATNAFLMQFQADILGVPVVVPPVSETTALGAAYLAGLGSGFWTSKDEVAALWRQAARYEPAMDHGERERLYARWRRAVELSRGWERSP